MAILCTAPPSGEARGEICSSKMLEWSRLFETWLPQFNKRWSRYKPLSSEMKSFGLNSRVHGEKGEPMVAGESCEKDLSVDDVTEGENSS